MHTHADTLPLQTGPAPPQPPSLARWRHALRSPLNAILTAAAVLETCPTDSAAAIEARRIIARQTRNLAWLISDMAGDMPDGGRVPP